MAKLAAERLDRGADAITTLQAASSTKTRRAADVLDLLEKQAERDKDFATVAEVARAAPRDRRRRPGSPRGSCRSSAASTPSVCRPCRRHQDLAARARDPAGPPQGAARAARLVPRQQRFRRPRRALCFAERLGGARRGALDRGRSRRPSRDAKVDLSFRTARILTDKLGAPERALPIVRAHSLGAPRRRHARPRRSSQIYENEEKWSRLPALYEVLLTAARGRRPEARALAPPRRRHRPEAR